MERIYIVTHYWDNGESYEDYRDYEDSKYFSTLSLASQYYWEKVYGDYEGKYTLSEVVLDTQETKELEESEYLRCSSVWDTQEDEDIDYSPNEDYYCNYPTEEEQEEQIISEWLTHRTELTEILSEIELDKLNDMLKELIEAGNK